MKTTTQRMNRLAAFLCGAIAFALCSAPVSAGGLTLSGAVDLFFEALFDDEGVLLGYNFLSHEITEELNLTVGIVVPIQLKDSVLGQPGLNWNDVGNWDNPALALTNALIITPVVVGGGAGNPSILEDLPDAIDALLQGGPTERTLGASVSLSSPDVPGFGLNLGASTIVKFDVTIQSSGDVNLNQSAKLHRLTVQSGAGLDGHSGMTIDTDLINHGFITNLGGTVHGAFANLGNPVMGERAVVNSLTVHGVVQNNSEIICGGGSCTLTFHETVANNGTIELGAIGSFVHQLRLTQGDGLIGGGEIVFLTTNTSNNRLLALGGDLVLSEGTVRGAGGRIEALVENYAFITSDLPGTIQVGLAGDNWTNYGTLFTEGGTLQPVGNWTNVGNAVVTSGTLTLSGTWTNAGQVTGLGGTLTLSGEVNNEAGTMTLLNSEGDYRLSGVTIIGGLLEGDSQLTVLFSSTLDGVTLTVDVRVNVGRTLSIRSGLTLHSEISLHATSSSDTSWHSRVQFIDGTQTLSGTGQIRFATNQSSSSTNDALGNRVFTSNAHVTIESGITIRGQGGTVRGLFDNHGLIHSDEPGTIRVGLPKDSWTNIGTLLAQAGNIVTDGLWINEGHLEVEADVTFSAASGIFHVDGLITLYGGTLSAGGGILLFGGELTGHGIVQGQIVNSATVRASGGMIDLTGSGNTFIQVSAGVMVASVDQKGTVEGLSVAGGASIQGGLHVHVASGFSPYDAQVVNVLAGGSLLGEFDMVSISGLSAPLFEVEAIYSPSTAGLMFTYVDGAFVGEDGGSWFDAENWAGGLPNAQTDVFLPVLVNVDGFGALARSVTVLDGGGLTIGGGSLATEMLIAQAGSIVQLTSGESLLTVTDLFELQPGSLFEWLAGTIVLDGALWSAAEPILIGCELAPPDGDGGEATLIMHDDALVVAPAVEICALGSVYGSGTIAAPVVNGGVISPGWPVGVLAINGTYWQDEAGALEIDLAGLEPGAEHDRLLVDAEADLAGTLRFFVDADAYEPSIGNSFTFVQAGDVVGAFSIVEQPGEIPHLLLDVEYGAKYVAAEVVQVPVLGDLNGNGSVGVPDLLILLASWGECKDCTPGNCPADLTGNCTVGVPDLLILLANWG